MSRHRAASIAIQPIRPITVVKAVMLSAIAGVVLAIIEPLGPLFAYMLGV